MQIVEMIWYTIPGAVFLLPLFVRNLSSGSAWGDISSGSSVVIGLSFLVGYVLHQMVRAIFERCFNGYAMQARSSVTCIVNNGSWSSHDCHRSFLWEVFRNTCAARRDSRQERILSQAVWELGTYNDPGKGAAIRGEIVHHIQRAWYYWVSFQTVIFASLLSFIAVATLTTCDLVATPSGTAERAWWLAVNAALVVTFWVKSETTLASINHQEVLLVRKHWDDVFRPYADVSRSTYSSSVRQSDEAPPPSSARAAG